MLFLRRLAWLLLPLAVILLILWQGREAFCPFQDLEAPGPAPTTWTAPQEVRLRIPILHQDGTPAQDAIVMSSKPEFAIGQADAAGVVELLLLTPGLPLEGIAYAPGHRLQRFSMAATPAPAVTLQRLSEVPAAESPAAATLPRRIHIQDGKQQPLAGALLLAHDEALTGGDPWLAFADDLGDASLLDSGPGPLGLEIYAPGLPPHESNRLGFADMGAGQVELTITVAVAYLEVLGVAGTMLRWEHRSNRDLLPMARLPESGHLRLGPVPLGDYTVQVGEQEYQITLAAGLQQLQLD